MPSGACFLGSTPECLYTRTGSDVASEAVAGTRARGAGGDVERDFWLAFDLLRSHKDHVEFTVVRDWVQQVGSGGVCWRQRGGVIVLCGTGCSSGRQLAVTQPVLPGLPPVLLLTTPATLFRWHRHWRPCASGSQWMSPSQC